MALAVVQSKVSANGSTGTTYSVALTNTPTVGNLIVVAVRVVYATTDWTFNSANYSNVFSDSDTVGKAHFYWATRVVQNGDTTALPSILSGTSGDTVESVVWEVSGQASVSPVDVSGYSRATTSTSLTTTVANDLLLASSDNSVTVLTQSTANWTTDASGDGFISHGTAAHFTGSTAATGAKTGPTWSASGPNGIIAIKPSAGGAVVSLETLQAKFQLLGLRH